MSKSDRAEYGRRYRAANKERLREARRARYAADPEKVKRRNRERLLASPEARQKKRDYQKAWVAKNREKVRRDALARKGYVFGPDQTVDGMLAAQNNACAICKRAFTSTPHIDHHATGRVRGLLCSTCNTGIGCLLDCPRTLLSAVDYLRAHGKTDV